MRKRMTQKEMESIQDYLLANGYIGKTSQEHIDCFDWVYTKKKKIDNVTELISDVFFLRISDDVFECNVSIHVENVEYGCINNGLSASFNVSNEKTCLRIIRELEKDFISMLKKYSDE